jgi:TolB-like protein/Tfp pilus assembly protein PilF/predicted Ser/Thr protein kinase
MTLAAGTRLGPFEILAPLGAGGMGEVYRARDTRLGREVAVKVLPAGLSSNPERLKRFDKEARSASSLNHPNIVTVYDIGESGGTSFIAMEVVDGRTLREILTDGALPPKMLLAIATQVADGLAKAHGAGIVHRDLKPENVMVTRDGLVKILDFGLAKLTQPEDPSGATAAPTVSGATEPGIVMGTVGYMSPEQALGKALDFRSDLFSFGSIVYEMATGRRAFARGSHPETLTAIIRDEPDPIGSLAPLTPAPLRRIVERCLAKSPDDRYASTRDLARDLQDLREELTAGSQAEAAASGATPASLPARRWRPVLLAAGAVVLALLAFASWKLLRPGSRPSEVSERARSIAVLPFQNFGVKGEDDYFADGMTESLITDLTKIEGMLVIARNSVFQYKGRVVNVKTVGKELGVSYILEGSVQRSGGRVRLNAQLIDVATGYHVWADRYDREMKDLFVLQDDISGNILAALKVKLTEPGSERSRAAPTKNLDAYDAYLRAVHLSRSVEDSELEQAIPLFEKAIALDPRFALAHAGLAQAYRDKLFDRDPRKEWEEKAVVEIEKALSLDPNLAEAYSARASVTWTRLNNYPHERAVRDYRRAIALNPNLAEAHLWLAVVYWHVGLFEKALEAAAVAGKLDPGQQFFTTGLTYFYWQKYDLAVQEWDKDPEGVPGAWKALALFHQGRDREASAFIEEFLKTHARESNPRSVSALLAARSGHDAKAEEQIALAIQYDRGLSHFHHVEYNIGSAYALMGKPRQAVEWLGKSAEHGFQCYPLFATDPNLASLRGDPGYEALLRKMKAEWEHYRDTL